MESAVSLPPAEEFAPSDLLSADNLSLSNDLGELADIAIPGETPMVTQPELEKAPAPEPPPIGLVAEAVPVAEVKTPVLPNLPTASPAPETLAPEIPVPTAPAPPVVEPRQTLRWQNEVGKISLHLPPEIIGGLTLTELWQQLQHRLNTSEQLWPPHTPVDLWAGERLLDQQQLQALFDQLATAQLVLKRIHTQRRQTAIAAASAGYAVEQEVGVTPLTVGPSCALPIPEPLYINTNLRSGTEICHAGSVIVLGDLNPGSAIIADGDIIIWGRLRGTVHAGAQGNRRCRIMALQMEATQLRIADLVARAPKPTGEMYPEVAYATPEGIRLCPANEKKWMKT